MGNISKKESSKESQGEETGGPERQCITVYIIISRCSDCWDKLITFLDNIIRVCFIYMLRNMEEPRVLRKTSRSLIICTYLYVSNPSLKSRSLLEFSPLYPSWNPFRAVLLELTNRWTSGWISPLELQSCKTISDNTVIHLDNPAT